MNVSRFLLGFHPFDPVHALVWALLRRFVRRPASSSAFPALRFQSA
jgi:hypothetical protein